MSPDTITLAASLVSIVALVLNYLRENPPQKVRSELDDHEERIASLESWRGS